MKKKPGFKIEKVWVFASVDSDGEEGIIGVQVGNVHWPMVAADEERMRSFRPMAQRIARQQGIRVKLVELTTRREIEVIE
jgi:hypothetical protein